MEPTKKIKPSRFISVRLPAMLKRSERRESGSLSAHAQLCSRELPKVESKDYRQHLVHCSIEAEVIMDMYSGKFYRYCNSNSIQQLSNVTKSGFQ